jgi:hypothetical protein
MQSYCAALLQKCKIGRRQKRLATLNEFLQPFTPKENGENVAINYATHHFYFERVMRTDPG